MAETEARKTYQREWYQRNKGRIVAQHKQYKLKNKEKVKEYSAKYYEINKEIVRRKALKYYHKNKKKTRKYHKEWRETHKEKVKEYRKRAADKHKEPTGASPVSEVCEISAKQVTHSSHEHHLYEARHECQYHVWSRMGVDLRKPLTTLCNRPAKYTTPVLDVNLWRTYKYVCGIHRNQADRELKMLGYKQRCRSEAWATP